MSTAELITNDMNALAVLNKSEIDSQIATAKAYPRDEIFCLKRAEKLALMTPDVAAEMFYVLKRGNNRIEGPSIRLAEVVASTWQNIRTGSRIIEIGDKMLTAQGICHDLESNVCMTANVERRITNKDGRRYNDDMIQTAAAAAQSIALRNAIFKVIPRGLLNPIYEKAKRVSVGDVTTIQDRWNKAVSYWAKHNIDEAMLLKYLEIKDSAEINDDHITTLIGLVNAVKEGHETIEQAFGVKVQTRDDSRKAKASSASAVLGPRFPDSSKHLKSEVDAATTMDEVETIARKASSVDDMEAINKYGEHKLGSAQPDGKLFDNQPHHE